MSILHSPKTPFPASLLSILIDSKALLHNLALIQQHVPQILPVVKANAYGHGLTDISALLQSAGIKALAVSTVGEAYTLRTNNYLHEIICLLGAISTEEIQYASKNSITLTVAGFSHIEHILSSLNTKQPITIAIKINTGMERLGFTPEEMPAALQKLQQHSNIIPTLVLSHLASADSVTQAHLQHTAQQTCAFAQACSIVADVYPGIRSSLSNSASSLFNPHSVAKPLGWAGKDQFTLQRVGLALYGITTEIPEFPMLAHCTALRPVMQLKAPILQIRTIPPGAVVSYSGTYTAPCEKTIAIIGTGYADGVSRSLSNKGFVSIKGKRAPIIGNVCMQMLMADISHIPDCTLQDAAYILGGESNPIAASEIAAWCNTIPYEIICAFGASGAHKTTTLL